MSRTELKPGDKQLLVEIDSAAIRCAAAGLALQRVLDHPDRAAVRQIAQDLMVLQGRCRELAGEIMDAWSIVRAFEARRASGKTSEVEAA